MTSLDQCVETLKTTREWLSRLNGKISYKVWCDMYPILSRINDTLNKIEKEKKND